MFQISAYTVFLDDKPETGRTKINYLLTGGTSPFFIWSGTTENVKQISLFKLDENYSNNVFSLKGNESGRTIYNFIFNGLNNVIDTTTKSSSNGDGSYNLINGINNKITIYGSGNTISGSGNTISNSFNSFFHGIKNETSGGINLNQLNVFSSRNSFFGSVLYGSFFSSKNLNIQSTLLSANNWKILASGVNNKIENSANSSANIWNSFILNGNNNKILLNNNFSNSASFHGIINGENNTINISNSTNNNYLFGSNLTAVYTGNSQFQNLHTDESLLVRNIKKYDNDSLIGNILIDINYSFHEIYNFNTSDINIHIPNSNHDLQVLSICLSSTTSSVQTSFRSNNFISPPTNISCKQGSSTNRYISEPTTTTNTAAAYFFIWTNKINKWVMFNADSSMTSFF